MSFKLPEYAFFSGANVIEKHIILDKSVPGPDQSVSIDMGELAELVTGIRLIEEASGDEKKVHQKESQIREWAFRSIVSKREIKKGEVISQDMIWSKRPGTGIPSHRMKELIGREAKRDIKSNSLVSWEDLG